MFLTHQNPVYEYCESADQSSAEPVHHPLIIIGAGPVGLAAAIDAGQQGLSALVLDDNNTVSVGSRAVCYSKRALEVLNRLGCAQRMVDKGVTWKIGKIFFRDELVRQFDLLPVEGHQQPAFINLQQYYLEEYLVERSDELEEIEVRWKNKLVGIDNSDSARPVITVDTPDGEYQLSCDWLVVADGANSATRSLMGLESKGQIFQDRFLIADIVMKADFPPERWFSFDPSYHPGQSTLLHSQPDDVWRLDFQLGWDADPEEEKKPENIEPRVRAMLGQDVEFELEWASVYTFTCRQMDRFKHGRVLFTGDAAHQVSPFGARGANSGFQDTDNLMWKLAMVMRGEAPEALIDTYSDERVFAARENLMNSTRATDFITPKTTMSRIFRNAVLDMARENEFAQGLANSGRLSDAAFLCGSNLNTQDSHHFEGQMVPGAVMDDAPIAGDDSEPWLLQTIGGTFALMHFTEDAGALSSAGLSSLRAVAQMGVEPVLVYQRGEAPEGVKGVRDIEGLIAERYDARNGTTYLCRPDQHVVARWRTLDAGNVQRATARATCNET